MHIEFLLEEASMEALLNTLLPRMLGDGVSFRLHNMGGKSSLLKNLESRLKGYASWIPDDYRIIVLVDEDRQDCITLKSKIEGAIESAGLSHPSALMSSGVFQCAVRICVEELEAWIFGDCGALRSVYPRVPRTLESKAPYRDPDAIAGGTWEVLERVLIRAGYYTAGMPKVEVATNVAHFMNVNDNRSKSFQVFRDLMITF